MLHQRTLITIPKKLSKDGSVIEIRIVVLPQQKWIKYEIKRMALG